jgi:hypothetical protein
VGELPQADHLSYGSPVHPEPLGDLGTGRSLTSVMSDKTVQGPSGCVYG